MKKIVSILLVAAALTVGAASLVRVIVFDSKAQTDKFLVYLQANGKGDISIFTNAYPEHTNLPARAGISNYSATAWNKAENCRHSVSNLWAVPLNDRRVDLMIQQWPGITNEFQSIWPGIHFQEIDAAFWYPAEP